MRVAMYVRVSTEDQEPDNQLVALREHASRNGWNAVEFVDRGISGAKERRPKLDRMLARVRAGEFTKVLVWKLDRLGRSLSHLAVLLKEVQEPTIDIVTIDEGINTTTPEGRMNFGILAVFAEFERERIRERIVSGIRRAKIEGKHVGRQKKDIDPTIISTLTIRQAAKALGLAGRSEGWRMM